MAVVLVTGAAGLIGSNVVRRLVCQDGDRVVVLDRLPPPDARSPLTGLGDSVKYVIGSVTDLALILNTMKAHGVDSVVHLAAVQAGEASLRPIEALEVNILGTAHLLEAARILGLGRVVAMSSSSVMGGPEDLETPRKEEDIILPATGIYPLCKLTIEQLVHTYRELYGVDAVALRPRAVFGPGISQTSHVQPVPAMVEAAVRGKDVVKPGADTVIDLTYVKDEVQGIVRALKAPGKLPRYVYNVSSGRNVSLGVIAGILQKVVPERRIELGPGLWEGTLGKGTQRDLTYRSSLRPPQDITRARVDFGFEPRWPMERAIPDFVHWLRTFDYGSFD